jgi:integrase
VLQLYLREHVAHHIIRKDVQIYRCRYLLEWWGAQPVTTIKRSTCQDYIKWRVAQIGKSGRKISIATARKDLETLGAALRYYHAENALDTLPVVTLPPKSPPREEWLTRAQVAALIRSARRHNLNHVARFILIAVYTGTRTTAILKLSWLPSTDGGWFDLDNGVLYRRGRNTRQTTKRQPPARLHERLLPHLRRWRSADLAVGIRQVIHWRGEPVGKLRRSWDRVRDESRAEAGIDFHFTRHTLRHTAATWIMQAGVTPWEAAGYLGMSAETLERVYGHHSPHHQKAAASAVAPKVRTVPSQSRKEG